MAVEGQQSLEHEVRVLVDGKPATLTLTREGVVQSSQPQSFRQINVYNVLWTQVNGDQLELSYIRRRKKGKQSVLTRSYWTIEEADKEEAKEWCEAVMFEAYKGVTLKRRLRILVNPHGGPGKARQIYSNTVEPIFQAARCHMETSFTERARHASELAKQLSLEFDALVLLSGDGLLHEVYNGFAEHDDPLTAFSIPVAPIPTGSANGMAINLLGIEDGFDVAIACLNAIKDLGKPMKQDICSVMLGDKRIFCYFSVSLGLMADLDLGTEHLRWMGDIRFALGYLYGVMKMKQCPILLEMKTAESDKDKMIEEFRERSETHWRVQHARELDGHRHLVGDDALPKLKHDSLKGDADEGWAKFDKQLIYFYAGSSPYVGRDFMQFPVAHASDGLIDIVAQEITTRSELLKAMDGAEKGKTFFLETQHYFKAQAYRITPYSIDGNLAIDGERYPLQPFTVECHKALGTLLSPTGHYAAEFDTSQFERRKQRVQCVNDDDMTVTKRKGLGKLLPCC
ncbi:LCB4 [Sanghuangporus sanghuang]